MHITDIIKIPIICLSISLWSSAIKAEEILSEDSTQEATINKPTCYKNIKMRNWQLLGPNKLLIGARKKVYYIFTLNGQCFTPAVSNIVVMSATQPDKICAGYKDYIKPIYGGSNSPPLFDLKTTCKIIAIEKTDEEGVDRLFNPKKSPAN